MRFRAATSATISFLVVLESASKHYALSVDVTDKKIDSPHRIITTSPNIDWSAASSDRYSISQCETIFFQWDTSDEATQQHSIVRFPSKQAYNECDTTQAVELVPPTPDIEILYRSEQEAFDCRKDCRSKCCTHDDRTRKRQRTRKLQKVKTCNTKKEKDCRDECFRDKNCSDDLKCKLVSACTFISCM